MKYVNMFFKLLTDGKFRKLISDIMEVLQMFLDGQLEADEAVNMIGKLVLDFLLPQEK